MKKLYFLITFLFTCFLFGQTARINEFHYDNTNSGPAGGDINEFVEVYITNPQPADLSQYVLTRYNGSNGTSYGTDDLSTFVVGDSDASGIYYSITYPTNGLQNGGPDGIALSGPSGLIEFISYEGSFTASGGAADGTTSTDVGVSQSSGTPENSSLYFDDADSTWKVSDGNNTKGQANAAASTIVQFSNVTGSLAEDGLFITIEVEINNEDTTNDTTVEIALDGSSTASNGTDYDDGAGTPAAITFPITLTFPAGTNTNQSFDIYISNDDMDVEGNETVVLNLQNPTGGNNAMIGANNQFTLTILDNDSVGTTADARINEFHYDNAGGDVGEFVEVFVADPQPADLNLYTITLYNGSGGASYDSETLDNSTATAGANRAGTPGTFYVWNSFSSGIQNGGPDGIALDYNGTVIQFISYEGVFAATNGPANGQSSTDVDGVSQSGSTPIGSSIAYNDDNMMWEESNDDTPGTTNGNFLSTINNQTQNKTIRVYVDAGYVKTTNAEAKSLEVYSVNGQRVAAANAAQVNVSNLQSGVYIVRIVDNNGQTTTQKFIKQ